MSTPIEQLPPGIYHNLPREQYDAQVAIRSSAIKAFHKAKTPAHYRYDADHPKDKSHFRIGNALDALIESPVKFMQQFVTTPESYPCKPTAADPRTEKPWSMSANFCKDWVAQAQSTGKTVLSVDERDQVRGMFNGLQGHQDIPAILKNCSRQTCIIAIHPTLGLRMKGLVDLFPNKESAMHGTWLFDLKSTGMGADCPSFHKQIYDQCYHIQAAVYLDLARFSGLTEIKSFGFIAIESDPPHGAAIHVLDYDDKETQKGRDIYYEIAPKLQARIDAGTWPSYPTDWHKVRFKPWMMRENTQAIEVLT